MINCRTRASPVLPPCLPPLPSGPWLSALLCPCLRLSGRATCLIAACTLVHDSQLGSHAISILSLKEAPASLEVFGGESCIRGPCFPRALSCFCFGASASALPQTLLPLTLLLLSVCKLTRASPQLRYVKMLTGVVFLSISSSSSLNSPH